MTGTFMTLSYVACMGISWAGPSPSKPVPMDIDTNNNTNSNANDNNENDNQAQSSNSPSTLTGKKRGASELKCNQTDSNSKNNKTKGTSTLNCSTNNTSHPATSFSQIPSVLLQEIALHSDQKEIINLANATKQSWKALANSVGQGRKDNAQRENSIQLTVKQFIEKISTYPFFYDTDFTIMVESPEAFTQLCNHPGFKKSLHSLKLKFAQNKGKSDISERITPSQWLDFATALQQSEITSLSFLPHSWMGNSLATLSKALKEVKGEYPKLNHLSCCWRSELDSPHMPEENSVIAFVETLSRFPNLESLKLDGMYPTEDVAKALSNQFSHLPKLRAINLGTQGFTPDTALNFIKEAKAHCKNITPKPLPHLPQDLELYTAKFIVEHPHFFNVLSGRGSQYGIKMPFTFLGDKDSDTLIQELLQFDLPYRDKVTQVRLIDNKKWGASVREERNHDLDELAQAISFFPNITQVDIRKLPYVPEKLRKALLLKPIKDLKISIPSDMWPDISMREQKLQDLLDFVPLMKDLDSLKISGIFTKPIIAAFMKATKNLKLLKFLTFSGKQLDDTAAKQLASSLKNNLESASNLTVLDLTYLSLTPAGTEVLIKALKKIQTVKPNFKIKFSSKTADLDEFQEFTLPPTINNNSNNSNSSIHNNNNTNNHSYRTITPSDTKEDMDESPDTYFNKNSNINDSDYWDNNYDWSAEYNPTSK